MKKSKIISIEKVDNETVYAMETTSGTFIADGVYHHNCGFRCNKMNSGEHQKYKMALDDKFGRGTYKKLEKLALQYPAHTHHFTREELTQIITDAKVALDFITK